MPKFLKLKMKPPNETKPNAMTNRSEKTQPLKAHTTFNEAQKPPNKK